MLITLGSRSISSPAACAICTQITPLSCILQKREMKEECILPCLGDTWLLIWSSKSYLYISKDVKNNTCSKTCYTAARNSGKSSTSLPFFDMLGKTLLSKTRCCWSIDILHGLGSSLLAVWRKISSFSSGFHVAFSASPSGNLPLQPGVRASLPSSNARPAQKWNIWELLWPVEPGLLNDCPKHQPPAKISGSLS